MANSNTPPADIDIGDDLAAHLLSSQFPEMADLPLQRAANGWDNVMYRLGDHCALRLPRREVAAPLIEHEARLLGELAPMLPLLIPTPIKVGKPCKHYPRVWTIVPWFEGHPVKHDSVLDRTLLAGDLGRFIAALHQPASQDAPHNPYRGVPLCQRHEATSVRIKNLADLIDQRAVSQAWEVASSVAPWTGQSLWVHGDLYPLNMVANNGRLVAVIDFGDITGGDPATDLMGAWHLFGDQEREVFRTAANTETRPIDDAMWERGRGWAIAHSLDILSAALNHPDLQPLAVTALERAVGSDCVNRDLLVN